MILESGFGNYSRYSLIVAGSSLQNRKAQIKSTNVQMARCGAADSDISSSSVMVPAVPEFVLVLELELESESLEEEEEDVPGEHM